LGDETNMFMPKEPITYCKIKLIKKKCHEQYFGKCLWILQNSDTSRINVSLNYIHYSNKLDDGVFKKYN
jgi:hypothetical protein